MQIYEIICSEKLRVMRKAYLTREEFECRQNCDGRNEECEKYDPIERDVPFSASDRALMRRV